MIDTGAPIKIIAQVWYVAEACVSKSRAMRLLRMRLSICNRGKAASVGKEQMRITEKSYVKWNSNRSYVVPIQLYTS